MQLGDEGHATPDNVLDGREAGQGKAEVRVDLYSDTHGSHLRTQVFLTEFHESLTKNSTKKNSSIFQKILSKVTNVYAI